MHKYSTEYDMICFAAVRCGTASLPRGMWRFSRRSPRHVRDDSPPQAWARHWKQASESLLFLLVRECMKAVLIP